MKQCRQAKWTKHKKLQQFAKNDFLQSVKCNYVATRKLNKFYAYCCQASDKSGSTPRLALGRLRICQWLLWTVVSLPLHFPYFPSLSFLCFHFPFAPFLAPFPFTTLPSPIPPVSKLQNITGFSQKGTSSH